MPEVDATATNATTVANDGGTETSQEATAEEIAALADPGKQALARMKEQREAAKAEAVALKAELEQFKQAQMSEAEKAIAQAREEGKTEGRKEATDQWSTQAVTAEFKAAFADREFDVDTYLESINTAKFLTDDGQINSTAITELANKLAPKPTPNTTYVQGQHKTTPPPALNSNALVESVLNLTGGQR